MLGYHIVLPENCVGYRRKNLHEATLEKYQALFWRRHAFKRTLQFMGSPNNLLSIFSKAPDHTHLP